MIVQIYAATSVEDALKMVELGVDQIGFIAGDYGEVYAELTFNQAKAITAALRGKAMSSALTMSTDIAEILQMADTVQPDIIHISSNTEAVGASAMQQLKQTLPPHIALMKAIHVDGPESVDTAVRYAEMSDILLLDTKVAGFPGVGATGVTHDWQISRKIIEQVTEMSKVVLAGGLTPENVAEAIRVTQPWAVDSNTGTNIAGDLVIKDMNRVQEFVTESKNSS